MKHVLFWKVSQKRQKRPKTSVLVNGYQIIYKVENKVKVELHFECSALSTLYTGNKWIVDKHATSENVFILRLALLSSSVTANAFAVQAGVVTPVMNSPADRVSDAWSSSTRESVMV